MMLKLKLPWFSRPAPRVRPRRPADRTTDADRRAREIAAELQTRSCGWWVVSWSGELRCYVAMYRGWLESGALRVEKRDPEELWRVMEPHIPIEARVPAVHTRRSSAALSGRGGIG